MSEQGQVTMKCPKCGQPATTYSLTTGIYEPCGHSVISEREKAAAQGAMDAINRIWNDLCGGGSQARSRRSYLYWRIPRNWTGTRYRFGYTPWETQHNGKRGFFALKYRETRDKLKLIKAVSLANAKPQNKEAANGTKHITNLRSSQPTSLSKVDCKPTSLFFYAKI